MGHSLKGLRSPSPAPRAVALECGRAGRLDRFLAESLTDLTRSRLKRLIQSGRVRVNGEVATKAGRALRAGDRVEVELPPPEPPALEAEPIPLEVLYEDPHLLVLDKPPGLPVHPGAGMRRGTLVNALLHRCPDLSGIGGAERPGIVHRLDKDTSGLLIVAKNDRSHLSLSRALKERRIRRQYLAIVRGEPRAERGRVEAPIGRHPTRRREMAAVRQGGRPAVTEWRVVERLGGYALLELTLGTGRTHQVRVHMRRIGHPVLGDPVYGGRAAPGERPSLSSPPRRPGLQRRGHPRSGPVAGGPEGGRGRGDEVFIGRQALHAFRLSLEHPVTGEALSFEAPLPEDMRRALAALRAKRDGPSRRP
ncbi:MAG: RluA family pseudouridine synthase [Nitrospinota bacterium]